MEVRKKRARLRLNMWFRAYEIFYKFRSFNRYSKMLRKSKIKKRKLGRKLRGIIGNTLKDILRNALILKDALSENSKYLKIIYSDDGGKIMSIKWKVNADSKVNMSKIHRCLNIGFSRILGGEVPLYRKEIAKPDRPDILYYVEVSDHIMVWIEYKRLLSNIDYIADDIPYLKINKILGELVEAGVIED